MDKRIIDLALKSGYDPAALLAFIEVETSGRGFDYKTGKIMIQFEPSWFKKQAAAEFRIYEILKSKPKPTFAEQTIIVNWNNILANKVSVQSIEWSIFDIAFQINPTAAMESTSIGLGQIMGFHWKRLGYKSVGEMWEEAKSGIDQQFHQLLQFISTDKKLQSAILLKDWAKVASIYNGAGYKELAARLQREPYDISMRKAYDKYSLITKK